MWKGNGSKREGLTDAAVQRRKETPETQIGGGQNHAGRRKNKSNLGRI